MSSSSPASSEYVSEDVFVIRHASGQSECRIHSLGATIIGWKVLGEELLFLSDKALFTPPNAIRGGIPVVFPQFGPGKLPRHGWARNSRWEHGETTIVKSTGDIETNYSLEDNEESRKIWPHAYKLTLTVVLKATSLAVRLNVENRDQEGEGFFFTPLLHSYFRVPDVDKVRIRGLKGVSYIDKVQKDTPELVEADDELVFTGEVDRVYCGCGKNKIYLNDGGNAELLLISSQFEDLVVWNPWEKGAAATKDLGVENYKKFVCVEAGSVHKGVQLEAGKSWSGSAGFSISIPEGPKFNQTSSL